MLGVGLRTAQCLGNPSLWLDELQLVRNITDRSMLELLLQGLDLSQVAPVGFLLPTKAITRDRAEGAGFYQAWNPLRDASSTRHMVFTG